MLDKFVLIVVHTILFVYSFVAKCFLFVLFVSQIFYKFKLESLFILKERYH